MRAVPPLLLLVARALTPLAEVAAAPEHELAPAAARALEWLQGARE